MIAGMTEMLNSVGRRSAPDDAPGAASCDTSLDVASDTDPDPVLDPAVVPEAAAVAVPDAAPPATSPRGEFVTGMRLSFAAGLGMIPIGVAFGMLVVQAGLPWWVAPGLSTLVFAGSVELLLVGLMAAATPLATIAVTVLLVNLRHVFYAFSFPLHVVRHPLARFYAVHALIDEACAVTASSPGTWTAKRLLGLQVSFHAYWVGGGLIGVLLASVLPGPVEGLEFALCALFLTLTLDACRSRAQVPSLLLAGLSLSLALVLVPGAALFAALTGFMVLLLLRSLLARRRGDPAPSAPHVPSDPEVEHV